MVVGPVPKAAPSNVTKSRAVCAPWWRLELWPEFHQRHTPPLRSIRPGAFYSDSISASLSSGHIRSESPVVCSSVFFRRRLLASRVTGEPGAVRFSILRPYIIGGRLTGRPTEIPTSGVAMLPCEPEERKIVPCRFDDPRFYLLALDSAGHGSWFE